MLAISLSLGQNADHDQTGSLAVGGGRDIAPIINELLALPFTLKIATRDLHPTDHISFATSHDPPNNVPFQSTIDAINPADITESLTIPLWPPHCVQGSQGAELIPEIEVSKFDRVVNKGRDRTLETFSGFADVFGRKSSASIDCDLAELLKSQNVTHVYTVGLAGDFCVKCTALDARKEGFEVLVIAEAVKSIDPGQSGWGKATEQMKAVGIHIVDFHGPEIGQIRQLSQHT